MKHIRKILLVGEDAEGGAAHSYVRILQKQSYEVEFFNNKKKYFPVFGGGIVSYLVNLLNGMVANYFLGRKAKKFRPDVILIAKGENITYRTLRKAKIKTGSLLVNFYPDNPFVFWNGNSNANVLRSLPFYDCFLTWSKMLIAPLISAGCKNVRYFPFVYDEVLFTKVVSITEGDARKYASDVCFVGTWEPGREEWLTKLVEAMPEIDLAIWGNMWQENLSKTSVLQGKVRGKAIYGAERLKMFRLSKIVLNFIRRQNMTSHNMRTMEVPASKAFLLTERTVEQAEELFREGESIACFVTLNELVSQIRYYLDNNKERERVMENSFERVQNYTLERAFEELFSYLGKL